MIKNRALLTILFLFWKNELQAYPSLFFTEEEVNSILENLSRTQQTPSPNPLKNTERLFFSGITYFDNTHWILWINDKAINKKTLHKLAPFHVLKVKPNLVKFSWLPPGTMVRKFFELHPGQTYDIGAQKVIDGIKK